jgi:cytidylate kinase
LKIFLTANSQERAQRRYKQLKGKGIDANLNCLEKEIAERDARDYKRNVAPLKAADGAIILDSTKLAISDVFQQVLLRLPDKVHN